MINLAELESKARAATQGEWSVEPHGSARALYAGRNNERHGLRLLNLDDGDRNIAANAAFIAAAQPSVVLELIERVREVEARGLVAWRYMYPIKTAPKDRPILAWCNHEADPYRVDDCLTLYAAHAEGLSHALTGFHIVEWGGGFTDVGEYGVVEDSLPDWWFVQHSEFEVAANPTHWCELPNSEAKAAEPVAWVPTRALEKLAADGAHIGVQTVIYSCERSSFHPLYAAPPDVSALQKRVRVLEEALRNALAVIVTTGPTQTHDHFGDRKLLNSTVAHVAGVLNAALGGSNE